MSNIQAIKVTKTHKPGLGESSEYVVTMHGQRIGWVDRWADHDGQERFVEYSTYGFGDVGIEITEDRLNDLKRALRDEIGCLTNAELQRLVIENN